MNTNIVTRFLDSRNVNYDIFEMPPEKLGAVETAEFLDVPVNMVYKSIILAAKFKAVPLHGTRKHQCQPQGSGCFLGQKMLRLTSQSEAEALIGLQTSGISPLALLDQGFIMIMDSSVEGLEEIHISRGERGINLRIREVDLKNIMNARVWKISSIQDFKDQ